jgi:type VI secretion system protein ImpE
MSESLSATQAAALNGLEIGDIGEVHRVLIDGLRARPDDQQARMFLFQLHCIDGAWEKARTQLKALAALSPAAQMLAVGYNQAIEAERVRAVSCRGGETAALLHAATDWAADLANAFGADAHTAVELRARAFQASPDMPGEIDGRPFDFVFDGDGRFGPAFEAIVAGRWGLIPFCAVEEIRSEGPVDLRDLVWLPAEVRLRAGGSVAALLPARYPGTEQEADSQLRLARRTEWRDGDGYIRGVGQRVWTTSGGEDVGILSFRHIRFAPLP